jgi:glutathione S-transferase
MSVKLFVDLNSQPSRAVHWALMLLKAPFQLHALRIDKGDTKTNDYLAIHPLGKVPAIQHNGHSLIESSAILVYLCSQFDIAGSLYPKQHVDRARIDAYLHWHHEFRQGLAGYFQALLQGKDLAAAEKRMDGVLKFFESYWLADNAFVQSPTATIADLQAVNELYQVTPFVPGLLERYPKVNKWVERMRLLPHHEEMMRGWNKVAPLLTKKFAASKL